VDQSGPTPEDRYIQAQIAADEAHQGSSTAACCGRSVRRNRARRRVVEEAHGEHPIDAFNVPFESWVDT